MKNVFTIDTEDWFHANYEDGLFDNNDKNVVSTIEKNVDEYLEIFEKYHVKATFFVLGCVAELHEGMVRKIASCGHEIASHGYGHQLVYKQTPEAFREDIRKSKCILEDIIGEKVLGYRAPSWSITEKSLWALDILEEENYTYTSSVFPTKNSLYGIPYAPRFKHDSSVYGKPDLKLIHIPPTTKAMFGDRIKVPFSGGAYFRLLPVALINSWTKFVNEDEKQPVIFYLHPREIDPKQPRLKLKPMDAMIHYYGINSCEDKLVKVLKKHEFVSIKELYNVSF